QRRRAGRTSSQPWPCVVDCGGGASAGDCIVRVRRGAMSVLLPGSHYPLGAKWDGEGVNFAIFSEHAERVELCLFSADGMHETKRLTMPGLTDHVWHGYLPRAAPGTVCGYRVHGPWDI